MHKVSLPLGMRDEFGMQAYKKHQLEKMLEQLLQQHDFMRIDTPLLEYQEVFADFDLKQRRAYHLVDNNEAVVLRPDLTLPIARFLATNNFDLPRKFYYVGERFKIAKSLSGKYNQMTQAGIEIVGYTSLKAELECFFLINCLSRKFLQGRVRIELGDACFADAVLDSLTKDAALKAAIKKQLYQKNIPQYQKMIAPFVTGKQGQFLQKWPRLFGDEATVLQQVSQFALPAAAQQIINKLERVAHWLKQLPEQPVSLDLSAAPPQTYYTGITFKGFSDDISDYLFSGGRYDHLLESFQKKAEPAVGMGIDLELLTKVADFDIPKPKADLLFFEPEQLSEVVQICQQHPNLTLCLERDLQSAQQTAATKHVKLFRIDKEGKISDAT
ncbi:ATP phosphoribosyltransferase regulatory subunit [Liquorilactobacillus satsumensis]|uniref:ATP phosphoribosyltransferase regulatory subunit n=1 Tax=Liquorilactobacillus satsumensis TaxID=259059 RepID=UPI001E64DA5C|nr:ATP phosphoribosyltransferase regulatory subunit [Liquorilactobacillus satsumensis]MCC7667370.1 ATP phosphoribosyltransferase regulatory subunit [Liquorilactobacillus satsumensis]MCP9313229.1 ATP phosphoribosyltransferase regulatory subunit [Liquorilactobacillus satsumensis]MCP9358190.1 ATP phosphoribosyltransferase regulatory subunit [Liquorilactobacillus satsumensis]MCP9360410.1 ATP phosphoribosyltransferase regulatory subunit [Liquorilactobacillus satsumensis]MCP9371738.1 ATP phosphoribo